MKQRALVVAASGGGSNLQALIDAIAADSLAMRIALVISDQPACGAVQRALAHNIAVCALPYPRRATAIQRIAWETQAMQVVDCFAPDIILLSGFMRILSSTTLAHVTVPLLNQHPALLPDDGGDTVTLSDGRTIPALRGAHVVRDAIAQRLPVTGCTIHRVVPEVDRGPVLSRAEVTVYPDDDEVTLHSRIRAVEQQLLITTMQTFV
ncbi:MAG: phosphoribosylglycinamide formyltransferase [Chloroflexi bacterium]|nr:MAG: phosphoribosylglycinamide formyltransferase [Chloroflexota bacterium]RLT32507.1 MAG: phosphoribosylglycinamide formyltransferase [Chloroflexota bacterium]